MNSLSTIADAIGTNIRIVGEGFDVTGRLDALEGGAYRFTADIGPHRIELVPGTQWDPA